MKNCRITTKNRDLSFFLFVFTMSVFYSNLAYGAGEFQRRSLLSKPTVAEAKNLIEVKKNKKIKKKIIKKKKVAKAKASAKKPDVTLDSLPKNYNGWRLLLVSSVEKKPLQCELRSDVKTMFDGVGNTAVELRINTEKVRLLTDSSIDSVFSGVGITMSGGEVLAFDYVEEDTNIVFDITPDLVQKKLIHDDEILIDLAFWPVSKGNRKYSSKIDAAGLKEAFRDLSKCEKLVADNV